RCGNYVKEVAAVMHAASLPTLRFAQSGAPTSLGFPTLSPNHPASGAVGGPGSGDKGGAATVMGGSTTSMIGGRARVLDAKAKCDGSAAYAGDVKLPEGMLHAKVLRSPVAHASIDSIDLSRVATLKGVVATLHWDEVPNYQSDRRFLNGKARYAGDAIAAVAAEDVYTAQHALELIGVSMNEI